MDKGASGKPDQATRPAAQAPSGLGDSASVPSAATFKSRYHGKGLVTMKRNGSEQKLTRKLRELLTAEQNGRCYFCHRILTVATTTKLRSTDATIEHLLPRSCGGELGPDNCVACCHACNRHRACLFFRKTSTRHSLAHLLRCLSGRIDELAQAIVIGNTKEKSSE